MADQPQDTPESQVPTPADVGSAPPPPANPVPRAGLTDEQELAGQVSTGTHMLRSAKAQAANAIAKGVEDFGGKSRLERLGTMAKSVGEAAADTYNGVVDAVSNPLVREAGKIGILPASYADQENQGEIPVEHLFGKSSGPLEDLTRTTSQFAMSAAITEGMSTAVGAEAAVAGLSGKASAVGKHALSITKAATMFELSPEEKKAAVVMLGKHQVEAPNYPMRRFLGMTIAAHTHPDVIDEVARLGHNFLPAAELEATMIMGHAGASAFHSVASDAFEATINKITDFTSKGLHEVPSVAERAADGMVTIRPPKVASPEEFKVAENEAAKPVPTPRTPKFYATNAEAEAGRAKLLAAMGAKADAAAAKRAPAPAAPVETSGLPITAGLQQASAEPGTTPNEPLAGAGAAQPMNPSVPGGRETPSPETMAPDMSIGMGEKPPAEPSSGLRGPATARGLEGPLRPEDHPTYTDSLGLGNALDRTVKLDGNQAPVEQAQREQYLQNLGLLHAAPGIHEEGWTEAARVVRAGGSSAITDKIAAHHGLAVPVGGSKLATHDFVRKLGDIVEKVQHEELPHILATARSVVKEWSDSVPFTNVVRHFQQVYGERNVAHYIVATHMALRVAADKAELTMHALSMAPESPAARDMAQRTYATIGHLSDMIRGVPVPTAETAADHPFGDKYALLSAERAGATPEANAAATAQLDKDISERGLKGEPAVGSWEGKQEQSRLVRGATPEQAAELGRKHGQEAVITHEGLHDLKSDMVAPHRAPPRPTTPEDKGYTEIGGQRLTSDFDFDNQLSRVELGRRAADQMPQPPLPPKVLDNFATDVRIAGGNAVETADAARLARQEAGLDAVPATDASRVPPPPKPPKADGTQEPQEPSQWQKTANSLRLFRVANMIGALTTYRKIAMTQGFGLAKQPAVAFMGGMGLMLEGKTVAGRSLMSEAWHVPAGWLDGLKMGVGAFARAFRNGTSVADPRGTTMFPTPKWTDRLDLGAMNFVNDIPPRIHTSMADFSKVFQYVSTTRSNTIREMAAHGEGPAETANAVHQRLVEAFHWQPARGNMGPITRGNLLRDAEPTDIKGDLEQRADAALDLARRTTLTQPLDNFLMGQQLREALTKNQVIKQAAAPFLTISTNDAAEKYAMVPGLGATKASVKSDLRSDDLDRRGRALGNMGLGAALMSTGFAATLYTVTHGSFDSNSGRGPVKMTGMPPANTAARKQAQELGAEWNTLQIGKVKIPLDKTPMAGYMIEMGGIPAQAYADHIERENERDEAWRAQGGNKWCYMGNNPVFAWLRHVSDVAACTRGSSVEDAVHLQAALALETSRLTLHDTWLSGASNILDILGSGATDETERQASRWAADQVATMNPMNAFWGSVNTDPNQREVRTLIDRFAQNMPGYSRSLEPQYNAFGEPVLNSPGFKEDLPFQMENPGRGTGSKLDAPNREQVLSWNTALPQVRKTSPGVNGQSDIDWTDRSWDTHSGVDQQSPWAHTNELLANPMWGDSGHETAAEAINNKMNSREFKALPWGDPLQPRGPRYTEVSKAMLKMVTTAEKMTQNDPRYEGFSEALGVTAATKKNNKWLGRRAADSAAAFLDQNPPRP